LDRWPTCGPTSCGSPSITLLRDTQVSKSWLTNNIPGESEST
jgi:hypothetical protein